MRNTYRVSMFVGCLAFMNCAAAQFAGRDIQRNEVLRTTNTSFDGNARNEGRLLFQKAKSYWHGDHSHPRDRLKAVDLFKLAARADYPPALYYLSQIYLTGEELPANEAAAIALLRRASDLGLLEAETRLKERGVIREAATQSDIQQITPAPVRVVVNPTVLF